MTKLPCKCEFDREMSWGDKAFCSTHRIWYKWVPAHWEEKQGRKKTQSEQSGNVSNPST